MELKILNSREIKEILELIEEQWGAKLKLDCGFLKNNKNRIFIVSKDISKIDTSKLRINSIGMYFCETDAQGIRLSIEGSQLIGPSTIKNVAEINEEYAKKWLKGEDLKKECKDCSGFVILKSINKKNLLEEIFFAADFLGTGKYKDGKILNYVGKSRRISAI